MGFDLSNNAARLVQTSNYYPFGLEAFNNTASNPKNYYLYNKKELQENIGLYDYGARLYDPVIGRWNVIDPLAEKGRRWSPYVYGDNNPVRFLDPDGMATQDCCGFFKDAWGSAKSSFTGYFKSIGNAVSHPINTVTAAYNSAKKMSVGEIIATPIRISPGYQMVHAEVTAVRAAINGDGKTFGSVIGNQVANTLTVTATTGIGTAVGKGINALRAPTASGLGDLTINEVKSIQGVVDIAERPLDVTGSAAKGARRGIGTDLPFGKGAGTRSDIDYLSRPYALGYFEGLQGKLPNIDPATGIVPGAGNEFMGPYIRFEPNAKPTYVPEAKN